MKDTFRNLLIALVMVAGAFSPALADDPAFLNTTQILFAPQTIAAGATIYAVVDMEKAAIHGAGYSFTTTGSINVAGAVTYSDRNLASGSTSWEAPSSIHSSTMTNTFTITADKKRTNFLLAPARFVRFALTNSDSVPVTLNWFSLFRQ